MRVPCIFMPLAIMLAMTFTNLYSQPATIQPLTQPEIKEVKINDSFWSPKFELWRTTTIRDVLDKFEGKSDEKNEKGELLWPGNAFTNFDLVAQGKRGIGKHEGFPWFDGLIYESIRGIADILAQYPDAALEKRIDGYIERIYAAQQSDPDGYLNTYTQLMEPDHRWGLNGGLLRWQHDVYNAGMLLEAGVHYYKATGKTRLLNVAVKYANYMYNCMGAAPKMNIVPAHSGPEEAAMKLYWLFKKEPELKKKMDSQVNEENYYQLAKFWIENRGVHCGMPDWEALGNPEAEKWIRAAKYNDPQYGNHSRPAWGTYAQDKVPFFQQKTIEGHAVRATLFATGASAVAIENKDPKYLETLSGLWDNMVGKRLFITGGVGAVAHDEKFGDDYYLPTDAYLETCAAVGAGFFSQRMNQLTGNAKYIDELERALYNGILTTMSATGTNYTYQNPLNAEHHHRWGWHECPCCPPMFLKMTGALSSFIYAYNPREIYVNLFIGSEAKIKLDNKQEVSVKQSTNYPWDGKVVIDVSSASKSEFALKIRIPGWANNAENPYGLYTSRTKSPITIRINNVAVNVSPVEGYATINRAWKKGDKVELSLPLEPRFIYASDSVKELKGKIAIASGPLVYCLEENKNPSLNDLKINYTASMNIHYQKEILNGMNVITGHGINTKSEQVTFTAIPYYALGNLEPGNAYKVWIEY